MFNSHFKELLIKSSFLFEFSLKFVYNQNTMEIIDSHAHLNFQAFDGDREEAIKRSLDHKIQMINVGSQYETSKKAIEIAREGVYASVGLHPIHSEDGFDTDLYRKLTQSDKVVAIGETGLDNYNRPKSKTKREEFLAKQTDIFEKQLDLAQELDLPVIVHCRSAHGKVLEILKKRSLRGVIHCFTGTWQDATEYLNLGFYIGFNGIIFKLDLEETIKKTPIDRILVETDCPYLTPPQREGRNEPIYIIDVIERLEELRGEDLREVTTKNTKNLFKL